MTALDKWKIQKRRINCHLVVASEALEECRDWSTCFDTRFSMARIGPKTIGLSRLLLQCSKDSSQALYDLMAVGGGGLQESPGPKPSN